MLAWELYLQQETSDKSLELLHLVANECYLAGFFLAAARAFDVLEQLDPSPEYWQAKQGACAGTLQMVIAGKEPPDALRCGASLWHDFILLLVPCQAGMVRPHVFPASSTLDPHCTVATHTTQLYVVLPREQYCMRDAKGNDCHVAWLCSWLTGVAEGIQSGVCKQQHCQIALQMQCQGAACCFQHQV